MVRKARAQTSCGHIETVARIAASAANFLGRPMGWFLMLLLLAAAIATFTSAYRRRLDVLTGPWIANEISRHD